jgi:hypothetical protein
MPETTIDKMAEDPSLDAYRDPATGQIQFLKKTAEPRLVESRKLRGLVPATPDEVQLRARYLQNTTMLGQAAAAGKLAARTATLGAAFNDPESTQEIKDFGTASPTLQTLTKVAGAAAPAIGAAIVAPEALAGLGLSARAAQIGTTVAEEVAGNTAFEVERAKEEGDGISVGNIIMGVGLGTGLSAVGRLARGGIRKAATESVIGAAESEGNALAQARRTSSARRSVGAAGAGPDARPPLTEAEVRTYAKGRDEIHAQVERFGGDAIEDAAAGTAPAFDEVHNIGLKKADLAGKMTDADPDLMADFTDQHTKAMSDLANQLDAGGQKGAARQIRAHLDEIASSLEAPEDLNIAFDRGKRTLDRLRTRYGAVARKDVQAEGIVDAIDQVVDPIRAGLEDADTWGKFASEKQAGENALWSGDTGIVRSGAVWQHEFLEKLPGAAGRMRRGLQEVPVFKVRGDVVAHAISMKPRDFELAMNAMNNWIDKVEQMSLLKTELGAASVETTPIMRLQQGLNDMKTLREELMTLREVEHRGANIIKKEAEHAKAQGQGELLFDALEHVPGIGHAVKFAEKASELTGKSIKERLFEPHVKPPTPEFTRESAGAAIRARRQGLGSAPKPRGPQGGPSVPPPPVAPPPAAGPSEGFQRAKAPIEKRQGQSGSVGLGSEPSIAGMSHADLGADKFRPGVLEGLRKDKQFLETGKPVMGGRAASKAITLRERSPNGQGPLKGSGYFLTDGSHRLQVAREAGRTHLPGVIKNNAGEVIYEGPVRISAPGENGSVGLSRGPNFSLGDIAKSPMGVVTGLGAAGLGAAALMHQSPVTDALAEISDNTQAIQERAALGLVSKESRPPKLPSLAERFKEGAPDLNVAFQNKVDDIRKADEDPQAFVNGMVDTYGAMAHDHPALFQALVARAQIGAQYLLANMPPSVGISMVRPNGIQPDTLAVMKFAAMYDAVFSPGNVVYDVATGDATPTQIRALREVHPDIYGNLRAEVLKQVAQAGQKIPFETLRGLDALFDLPGVAGPAFSPGMTTTMAQAYATPGSKSPKQSLGGESVLAAPPSATTKFAGLAGLA